MIYFVTTFAVDKSFMKKILLVISIVGCSCSKKNVQPPGPISPVPNNAQLAWHNMELNAFVHFTVNTFTDKEWGYGDEGEKIFDPTEFNPGQWTSTLKAAGFKGLILTCKHHDGFCL